MKFVSPFDLPMRAQRPVFIGGAILSLSCLCALAAVDLNDHVQWMVEGKAFKKAPKQTGLLADTSDAVAGAGAKGALQSNPFVVDSPYLNFEIAGGDGAFRTALSLWADGRVVRTATGEGSDALLPRHFDLSDLQGKTVFVELVDQDGRPDAFLRVGKVALSANAEGDLRGDVPKAVALAQRQAAEQVAQWAPLAKADPKRPVWHLRPPSARLNDANGPFFADGYYHIFYQFNPFMDGYMMWAHARSKDLVNWEHLPVALWPDWEKGEYHCYSGSAFMVEGKPQLFYTFVPDTVSPRNQWKAVPADPEYKTWIKPDNNPLITFKEGEVPGMSPSVRDPFVFEADGKVFMLLCGNDIYLYEAQDKALDKWKFLSVFWKKNDNDKGAECPNFFRFGDRWVLMLSPFGPVRYEMGTFDAQTGVFTKQTQGLVNHASGYYATTGMRDDNGRLILYGHLKGMVRGADLPKVGWRDALALPRVLDLATDGTLRMIPVPEAQVLRDQKIASAKGLTIDKETLRVPGLSGDVLELKAVIRPTGAKTFGVRVRAPKQGQGGFEIRYDVNAQTLFVPGSGAVPISLSLVNGALDLHLFLDKSMLEVFAGEGRVAEVRVMSAESVANTDIEFFASGGAVLETLEAWTLKPASEGKIADLFPMILPEPR